MSSRHGSLGCSSVWRRRLLIVLAGAVALSLVFVCSAAADALSNISPAPEAHGGLFGEFALGNYALDSHFSAISVGLFSGVDVSGVPPMIAFFLANTIWQLTAFLANSLITVFTWAFSLNLLTGSSQTGGVGALAPVSAAMQTIYGQVLGAPWLTVAIALTGVWAMWRALVQRRYTETAGSLGVSVVFVLVALFIVTQPERTIGTAGRWTNDMSTAFLSLTADGSVTSGEQAKQVDADQLFRTLVFDPWVVLEFGGIEHYTKTGTSNSVPVQPLPADASHRLLSGTEVQVGGRTCINDANKYADHFLRDPPASGDRNSEYDALKDGDSSKLPSTDPTRSSYHLGAADQPATDAMGKGGQYERLLLSLVAFAGELGAFLLLGALSIGVVIAQIVVLVLLAFAPVALVIAVLPGRGHQFFVGWLQRLLAFLVRKAIYSLILAVLLAVSSALVDATQSLGWLLSFLLQAAFFWTVFMYRHQLVGQLSGVVAGHDPHHAPAADLAAIYYARRLFRGSRNGSTPPAPSAAGSAASGGRDDTPPVNATAGPVGDPEPPNPSPSANPDWDLEPAGEQLPAGAQPVAQLGPGAPAGQVRPRLALPAPRDEDRDSQDGAGPAEPDPPTPPADRKPDGPPVADQPSTATVKPTTARAPRPAIGPAEHTGRAATEPTEPPADHETPQPDPVADQEPSLAEQLRTDHAQREPDQPAEPRADRVADHEPGGDS